MPDTVQIKSDRNFQHNLYTMGRPLWGALIKYRGVNEALKAAEKKLYGGGTSKDLDTCVVTTMFIMPDELLHCLARICRKVGRRLSSMHIRGQ
jgi:hypothetical protein